MSEGLQISNASGKLILDISNYIYRLHGVYYIPPIAKRSQYVLSIPGYAVGIDWSMQLLTVVNYIRISEQSGQIVFFNESYYTSYGGLNLAVFRRK